MKTLAEICHISSGISFRQGIDIGMNGSIRVVRHGDVNWDTGSVDWESLLTVTEARAASHHYVRSGDILFAAKGQINRAVYVTSDTDTLVTSTFFILRAKKDYVLPVYLSWYINTEAAQLHFRTCTRGTSMPSVPKTCLSSLPVPIPPVETQHQICRMQALMHEERLLTEFLIDKRNNYITAACLKMISSLSPVNS